MSTNEIEVHGAEEVKAKTYRQHQEGDAAVYFINNQRITGSIDKIFEKNGRALALFEPFTNKNSEGYTVDITDKSLQSLMYENKKGEKTRLKFSYQEVAKLFYGRVDPDSKEKGNKIFDRSFNINYNKAKDLGLIFELAKGYESKVVSDLKLQIKDKESNSIRVIPIEGTLKAVLDPKYGLKLKANSLVKLTPEGELNLSQKVFDYELTNEEKEQLQLAFKNKDETKYDLGLKSVEIPLKKTGEIVKDKVYLALNPKLQKVVAVNEKAVSIDKIYKYEPTILEKKSLKEGKHIIVDYPVSKDNKEKRAIKIMVTNDLSNRGVSFSKPGSKLYEKLTNPSISQKEEKKKGIKIS